MRRCKDLGWERRRPILRSSANGRDMTFRSGHAWKGLSALLFVILAWTPAPAPAQQVRLLVQRSSLAGYNFHEAAKVFESLQLGDALILVREPHNPHDAHAVRVVWKNHTLGYVPRADNATLAWALDKGEPLAARISRLQRHRNARQRLEIEVFAE